MTHPRTFAAAIALSVVLIAGYSGAQTVKCTTWNLEWFPNGSAKEASAAQQEQRIKEAADVLRPINPDILFEFRPLFDRRGSRSWHPHLHHMHLERSCCEKFLSRYEDYWLSKSIYEPRCRDLNRDVLAEVGGRSVIQHGLAGRTKHCSNGFG